MKCHGDEFDGEMMRCRFPLRLLRLLRAFGSGLGCWWCWWCVACIQKRKFWGGMSNVKLDPSNLSLWHSVCRRNGGETSKWSRMVSSEVGCGRGHLKCISQTLYHRSLCQHLRCCLCWQHASQTEWWSWWQVVGRVCV